MHKTALFGLIVLSSLIVAALFFVNASGQDANQLPGISDEQRIMNADDGYPDVVAMVNGDSISGKALSVEVAQLNSSSTGLSEDVPAAALGMLIREQLLLQEAKSDGVWPTSEDVDAAIDRFVASYEKLPANSDQKKFIDGELALQAIDPTNLKSNDLYREATEHDVAIGAVQGQIRASLPESQRNDPNSVTVAEADLVTSLWAKADIQLFVQITPEMPKPVASSIDQ